jgi:hypothetical protein
MNASATQKTTNARPAAVLHNECPGVVLLTVRPGKSTQASQRLEYGQKCTIPADEQVQLQLGNTVVKGLSYASRDAPYPITPAMFKRWSKWFLDMGARAIPVALGAAIFGTVSQGVAVAFDGDGFELSAATTW